MTLAWTWPAGGATVGGMDDLDDLLGRVPEALRVELEAVDCGRALDLARQFVSSNEEDQAGMMAFIESAGPRRVHELKVNHRDGTPTSADLASWPCV